MNIFKHRYFECVCNTPEHTLRFTCVQDPIFHDDGQLYVEAFLNPYHPWYRRLWVAIKYTLGIEQKTGAFDCTILSSSQCANLIALLEQITKVSDENADKIN